MGNICTKQPAQPPVKSTVKYIPIIQDDLFTIPELSPSCENSRINSLPHS